MFPSSIGQFESKEAPHGRFTPVQEIPRRVAHGGMAWAVSNEANLHQPQDGVTDRRRRVKDISSRLLKLCAGEPEDARLTGGTRSLMRRLSGLNLVRLARPKAPQSAVGTRATSANVA